MNEVPLNYVSIVCILLFYEEGGYFNIYLDPEFIMHYTDVQLMCIELILHLYYTY